MAHLEYYNNIVGINDMIYDSHKLLLEKVTMELGQYDKFDELCDKFLDQPKLKAKKDMNAPKKAKSAFMLFCDNHREDIMVEVKKQNKKNKEKFNLGHVQKKLGEMWSGLDSTELAKYSDLADKDKDRYSEEYESYQEQIYGSIYSSK
jgi:hypothetical protein